MKRLARVLVAVAALLAIVLAWSRWREQVTPRETPGAAQDSSTAERKPMTLWFASADAESLVDETRELPVSDDLRERVAGLVAALAQGPTEHGIRLLPSASAVEQAFLDEQGLLTLNLSRAFRSDFRGGALAEEWAIASMVRTVRDNCPEVRQLRLLCAGGPIASLGGHLALDEPLDPEDW